jgi:stage IV sporulation protein FB
MYSTDSLLTFSFPMGRFLNVPLRLSFLMPVVAIALMWRMQDPLFGLLAAAILVLSLVVHELAHIVLGRQFRQHPGTVVLWPLGGMQSTQMMLAFPRVALIGFAGPLASLSLAFLAGYHLHQDQALTELLNPFGKLDLKGDLGIFHSCMRMTFFANWCLALVNLLPVQPLDCGQVFASFLNLRFMASETRDLMLRLGLVLSLFGLLSGFVFDISGLVALSAFLFVLHLHEASRWTPPDHEPEESFLGYDFSEGFTSLERSGSEEEVEDPDADASNGLLERWRSRRDEEKLRRDEEERQFEEKQLDVILEKLHGQGRESLSSRELNLLNRVSARLRQRHVQE